MSQDPYGPIEFRTRRIAEAKPPAVAPDTMCDLSRGFHVWQAPARSCRCGVMILADYSRLPLTDEELEDAAKACVMEWRWDFDHWQGLAAKLRAMKERS